MSNALRPMFLLLVLANMLMFATGRGYFGRIDAGTESGRLDAQIQPERLHIVGQEVAASPQVKSAEKSLGMAGEASVVPATTASACLSATELTPEQALVLAEWLRPDSAKVSMSQDVIEETVSWWVYLAPVRERQANDQRMSELRRLGIKDFYVVQDAGPHFRAISLGVFKAEDKANEALATLTRKGVKNARAGPRDLTARVNLRFVGDAAVLKSLAGKAASEKPALPLVECPPAR